MNTPVVWIVDDEPAICWSLRKALESHGLATAVYSNAESAIQAASDESLRCNVLITDIRLPKGDGFQLAESMHRLRPDVPIILMTAFGDLSTAVKAMQTQVFEYLVKPFDLKDALQAIEKAIANHGRSATSADFSLSIHETLLLGRSTAIRNVYRQIAMAARSNHSVLICGAEGAPLESVASAIHRNSECGTQPFLSVLPTAISLASLEREFVGSAQLDRTGEPLKTGLLGLVGEGTLFIDEIADLPRSLQSQLLRVLEHSNYLPFDARDSVPFHGRVIVSSTRELGELTESAEFDSRLAERLQVHRIDFPSLDSRREDALDIAQALIARSRPQGMEMSPEAKDWITKQSWPGDVRQLRNTVEKGVAGTQSDLLSIEDLQRAMESIPWKSPVGSSAQRESEQSIAEAIRSWLHDYMNNAETPSVPQNTEFGMLYDDFLSVVEPPMLTELFQRLQFNRAATAAKLGMHRSTLRQKMRKYGIDGGDYSSLSR